MEPNTKHHIAKKREVECRGLVNSVTWPYGFIICCQHLGFEQLFNKGLFNQGDSCHVTFFYIYQFLILSVFCHWEVCDVYSRHVLPLVSWSSEHFYSFPL